MMLQHNDNNPTDVEACSARGGRLVRFGAALVELLRHREHGKTARTLAICTCVLGAIMAVSAARVLKQFYWLKMAKRKAPRGRQAALQRRTTSARLRQPSDHVILS
jgi:hypothetical protein